MMKYILVFFIIQFISCRVNAYSPVPADTLLSLADQLTKIQELSQRESFDSVLILAEKLVSRLKDEQQMIELYMKIGTALEKSGQTDSALLLFDHMSRFDLNDFQKISVLRNKGNIYYMQGVYEKALEKYLTALPLALNLNRQELIGTIKNNIGLVYWKLRKYDEAIEILNETLILREKIQSNFKSSTISTLANVYYELGEFDKVLQMDLKSLQLNLQTDNKFRIAVDYNNIGEDYMALEDYVKSEQYLLKSLALRKEIKHTHGAISTLVNLSMVAQNKNKMKEAEELLYRALFLADSINARDQKYRMLPIVKNFEEERGNFQKALKFYDQYIALKDSMFDEQKSRQIEEMVAKYETEKKELENVQLKNEMQLQSEKIQAQRSIQYLLGAITVLVIILLLVVYRSYRHKQYANIEITKQRNNLEILNKAKSRFFSIISHDMRGPLSTMIGFSNLIRLHVEDKYPKQKDEELNTFLMHMETAANQVMLLLDTLMKWAMKEEGLIPYHPESFNLKQLIVENNQLLEPQAIAKGIHLNENVPDHLEAWVDKNTFLTIIRNLTGNALKFTEEGGQVTLAAKQVDGKVELKVEDSGIGIPKQELKKLCQIGKSMVRKGTKGEAGSGLGLNLVHDFVKLNKGELIVDSEVGKGTTFILYFPMAG